MDINKYNVDYFYSREWERKITYKGIDLFKYPSDIVTYQQIIWDTKPEVILETGTCAGSSAIFFYDTMLSCGVKNPLVITSDINKRRRVEMVKRPPYSEGVLLIEQSSLADYTINMIKPRIENKRVMVSLDSDHTESHVLNEINTYHSFVTPGNYLVVEDTFLGEFGPFNEPSEKRFQEKTGKTPKHAVQSFLKTNSDFTVDNSRDKVFTMNPGGWLRKNEK
jgi:cephalosporin hydroxylase